MPTPRIIRMSAIAMAIAALVACGSDEGSKQGVFVDSEVAGLEYTTSLGLSGRTDVAGSFSYNGSADVVTFKIGSLILGQAPGASRLTPMSLTSGAGITDPRVLNRLQLVQSLDADGNPENGITLDAALSAKVSSAAAQINLAQADVAAFEASLAAALGKAPRDRGLAREHFESSLSAAGESVTSVSEALSGGSVAVRKMVISVPERFNVPYEGSAANMKAEYPKGLPMAPGSAMTVKAVNADGSIDLWVMSDRGPNADGPNISVSGRTLASKVFPAPSFAPSFGVLRIAGGKAELISVTPMINESGVRLTGMALPPERPGASGEAGLNESLALLPFDALGLDPEGIVFDKAANKLWISDEYGPFIVRVDATSGRIDKRVGPNVAGTSADSPWLPAVLNLRRANRGMEGLAMDAAGKLHGVLQSPIATSVTLEDGTTKVATQSTARFVRWVVVDPVSATSKTYAYPLSKADWRSGDTGQAKMGDLTFIGGNKFVGIEQGLNAAGNLVNKLMLIEIPANATDISAFNQDLEASSEIGRALRDANFSTVVPLKRSVLLDLNAAGWMAEKAEGLTLIDDQTLALTNDNDFGVVPGLYNKAGNEVTTGLNNCLVSNGALVNNGALVCNLGAARVKPGTATERPNRLYTFRFPKKLSEYVLP